jgi:hypothetical protein
VRDYPGEERRRADRFQLGVTVAVATRAEQVVNGGRAVDASAVGILVSFPGPALSVNRGDRCLVSLHLPDRVLHLVGEVTRKDRGDDDRYYVGIEYERLPDSEVVRLRTREQAE